MTRVSAALFINFMHDFLLAKEIVDELLRVIAERNIQKIKNVSLEIGNISMSHDGHPEHLEEINIHNLEFGIKGITKGTLLEGTKFRIGKSNGDHWRIVDIEVE